MLINVEILTNGATWEFWEKNLCYRQKDSLDYYYFLGSKVPMSNKMLTWNSVAQCPKFGGMGGVIPNTRILDDL